MGKKKKVTIGYRYFGDIQVGLGRGPVDEIVAITADEKVIVATKAKELTTNTQIMINKPTLFGGTDAGGEGGVQGILEIAMGEKDQTPSDLVRRLLTGIVPGFRGKLTTFFSGYISAYSSTPKPWSYRVRRATKGWSGGQVWYGEKAMIKLRNDNAVLLYADELTTEQLNNLKDIYAMNPAHILLECITNKEWGRGLSLYDYVDIESFKLAADALYNEGFGLCFRYNRQDSINVFVQQILDHIGGVQYGDLSTGKIVLKLLRNDYQPENLPSFTYNKGIISVQEDDTASMDSAPNEIIVTWHDPVTHQDREARAQNLGSIQTVGLISSSVEYRAIPTIELALRVAQRDLEEGAAGLTRLTINFDRRGGIIKPGDCFCVSLPERGIDNIVMRAGEIREQSDGALKITAVQDVFGLPATVYNTGDQQSSWIPPDRTAKPVSVMQLIELPYTTLAATIDTANLEILDNDAGFIGILAQSPNNAALNYQIQSRTGSNAFNGSVIGDFTPHGYILTELGKYQTTIGIATTAIDLSTVEIGDAALIDNEIVRVDGYDINAGMLMIARGCADTLPVSHNAGATIWFYDSLIDSDNIEYTNGEKVDVRLVTRTSTATLDANLATVKNITMSNRQIKPYPPGNLKVDGVLTDQIANKAKFKLTWAHRDRLLQADKLVSHTEASVGPEAGTSYIIKLYRNNTLLRTIITQSNVLEYPDSQATENFNKVRINSVRDGFESLYYELSAQ